MSKSIRAYSVQGFLALAKSYGVEVITTHSGILRLEKKFPAGDAGAYGDAETKCMALMAQVPVSRPGSTWGTTSNTVGGMFGLRDGCMVLNKSGVNKIWMRQINTEKGKRS